MLLGLEPEEYDASSHGRRRTADCASTSCSRSRPDDVLRGVTPFAAIFVPQALATRSRITPGRRGCWTRSGARPRAPQSVSSLRTRLHGSASPVAPSSTTRRASPTKAALSETRRSRSSARSARRWAARQRDYVHLGRDQPGHRRHGRDARRPPRRALVLAELDRLADGCARLARAYRSTPMAARTLLQQAVPTTFGLKAAGLARLGGRHGAGSRPCDERLAAQLGGAAGTSRRSRPTGSRSSAASQLRSISRSRPPGTQPTSASQARRRARRRRGGGREGRPRHCAPRAERGGRGRRGGGGRSSTMPQKRNPVRRRWRSPARGSRTPTRRPARRPRARARARGRLVACRGEALSGALAFAGGAAAAAAERRQRA